MGMDVLAALRDERLVATVISGRDWPRAMLRETPIPDAWMGLVEHSDGRRRFVSAGQDPRPGPDDSLLLVRNRAISVPLTARVLPAARGNLVDASGDLLIRWPQQEADLAALHRWLRSGAGGAAVSVDGATRLESEGFTGSVLDDGASAALREFIRALPATELVERDQALPLLEALRAALRRWCFECGATLDRLAGLSFTSDTLRVQQTREREVAQRVAALEARRAVEAAAAEALRQRIDGLGGVLEKLRDATSTAAQDASIRDLLPALSPAERGRLLENLWRVTPNRVEAVAIVAVAGDELLWCDPTAPGSAQRRQSLPDDLGLPRSISAAGGQLLIGAANGVWRLDAATGEVLARHAAPTSEPQRTGFNSAALWDGNLVATHSGLGCWNWPLDSDDAPRALLTPRDGRPRGVRCATVDESGDLFFTADEAVWRCKAGETRAGELLRANATIHSLAAIEGQLYAGTGDGVLLRAAIGDPERRSIMHRTRNAIESISLRCWFDLVEAVIPAGDDGVLSVYGDENVVVRLFDPRGDSTASAAAPALRETSPGSPSPMMSYASIAGTSSGFAVRRVWAADDVVVMLSARRDRLLILNNRTPEIAAAEFAVGKLTGRSVQDACLVTRGAAAASGTSV